MTELLGDVIFVDRILGVIFGTAIGDALGWPVEFDSKVTPDNQKVFPESIPERYTDDTQMFRAVCEGMLRWASSNTTFRESLPRSDAAIGAAAEEVSKEFVAWLHDPENNRAPGSSCLQGCARLEKGVPWRSAGMPSGGCGTAMRSMAYGIFFWEDPEIAAHWAAEHAVLTHDHAIARAAAAAVAAGVAKVIGGGVVPGEILEAGSDLPFPQSVASAMESAAGLDSTTQAMLHDAWTLPDMDPNMVLDRWRGWAGHEATAASLWCFQQHPNDFEKAVLLAVNSPGDSDSLGAITGALVGGNVGFLGISNRWTSQVEDRQGLLDLARRICARLGLGKLKM